MAQALGAELLDDGGQAIQLGGGNLNHLKQIKVTQIDPRIKKTEIIIASDVTNPLIGKRGASAVFGPQKGATPEMVQLLDQNLTHYAKVLQRDLGLDLANCPGAGLQAV